MFVMCMSGHVMSVMYKIFDVIASTLMTLPPEVSFSFCGGGKPAVSPHAELRDVEEALLSVCDIPSILSSLGNAESMLDTVGEVDRASSKETTMSLQGCWDSIAMGRTRWSTTRSLAPSPRKNYKANRFSVR